MVTTFVNRNICFVAYVFQAFRQLRGKTPTDTHKSLHFQIAHHSLWAKWRELTVVDGDRITQVAVGCPCKKRVLMFVT